MFVQIESQQLSAIIRVDLAGRALGGNRHGVPVVSRVVAAVVDQQRSAGIGQQVGVLLGCPLGGEHDPPQIGRDGESHQAGVGLLLVLGRQHPLNLGIQQGSNGLSKLFGCRHCRWVRLGNRERSMSVGTAVQASSRPLSRRNSSAYASSNKPKPRMRTI